MGDIILGNMEKAGTGQEVLFSRHLEEIDDLEKYGRDAPIEMTPENHAALTETATSIFSKMQREDKKAVLFITSPRIRATQTADLIGEQIRVWDGSIRTVCSVNEKLRSTDQGEFRLPEAYIPGESFEALKTADRIFRDEVHENNNIDYHFGDPSLLPDGTYRIPN